MINKGRFPLIVYNNRSNEHKKENLTTRTFIGKLTYIYIYIIYTYI